MNLCIDFCVKQFTYLLTYLSTYHYTYLMYCCTVDTQHNLRKRRHNLALPEKKGHLAAKNFIIRLLYKETY